jgi:predicted Rossmann fold flavoprotein
MGAITKAGQVYSSSVTLIATGGLSYPLTGSTGDGLRMAQGCGHSIITPTPSLVALKPEKAFPNELNGLTLRNVRAELRCNGKKVADEFGEMTFLDGYLAGPIIITLSRGAVLLLRDNEKVEIILDLKPALEHPKLDQRLLRDIEQNRSGSLEGIVARLLPDAMRQFCLQQTGLNGFLKASQISQEHRRILRNWRKEMHFAIDGHAPWSQAIVTAGGINTREINPATMQSRLVDRLFFAGEVIDIDADTGGYNLQAAFSTGWLAGKSAADLIRNSLNKGQ